MAQKKAKIAICHYRIGRTDGVSLEIEKRKKALASMGHMVKLISGPRENGTDFVIRDLEFDRPQIKRLKENAFFKLQDYRNGNELMKHINAVSDRIKNDFLEIHEHEHFDYLFLHNILTHGRHIAAAKAFTEIGRETDIRLIALNHDFYETYNGLYTPQCKAVKTYLKEYVPPQDMEIKHVCINSLSQKLLYKKIARPSLLFPDTFDFSQPVWKLDNYNAGIKKAFNIKDNDIVVLQATRIVERKAIELSVSLVEKMNENKDKLHGNALYNGKIINNDSEILLVFAGFIEPASREYWGKLKTLMKEKKIKYRFLAPRIEYERSKIHKKKIYSLWDAYAIADLIAYPSIWEGFGNQFLEALFAKKPIVLYEYPVFLADIKPEGYEYISFGSKHKKTNGLAYISKVRLKRTAKDTIACLLDKNTAKTCDNNFLLGKKYHGEKTLKKLLQKCLAP